MSDKQSRTYTYDATRFLIEVTFTGWFCVFVTVACIIMAIMGIVPGVMAVCAVVAFYTAWNTFVSRAYPREVTVDDESISFTCFGRTDTYRFADIDDIRVREFPYAYKSYVRINGGGMLKGRYWVRGQWFDDGEELYRRITDIECTIMPDSLKARARAYAAAEKTADADKAADAGKTVKAAKAGADRSGGSAKTTKPASRKGGRG
jgi:hypothetical protein